MSTPTQCEDIYRALEGVSVCVETEQGACFTTHCLYPSFDPVLVFVMRVGEGYEVHDGGGAMRSAWDHGREVAVMRKILTEHAHPHKLAIKDDSIVASIPSHDWLLSAILTVANVSAAAARAAIDVTSRTNENTLKEMIYSVLSRVVSPGSIAKDYELRGASGKVHHFDYAVPARPEQWIIMDAVTPHHVSIAAKYVAFSDTGESEFVAARYAVHEKPLAVDDISLLKQVADIVPFKSLELNIQRRVGHRV